jgi:hypothetical protein
VVLGCTCTVDTEIRREWCRAVPVRLRGGRNDVEEERRRKEMGGGHGEEQWAKRLGGSAEVGGGLGGRGI